MDFEKAMAYIGMAFVCGKIAGKAIATEATEEKQGKHEITEKEIILDGSELKGKEAKEFVEFLNKLIGGKKNG